MTVPDKPKIYHIVHLDRLQSIVNDGYLFADSIMINRNNIGSVIGLPRIKQRRLTQRSLNRTWPDLFVGECVPFYFCPRSIMLYVINCKDNPDLPYQNGQEAIIHLQADLLTVIQWAKRNNKRWAFTDCNASSFYATDYNDLKDLNKLNWDAISSRYWFNQKDAKQAEFLIEKDFPFSLFEQVGVYSKFYLDEVNKIINTSMYTPTIKIQPQWYY